jgi:drug/metabolite transporter (DMT)-like permease
LTGVVADVMRGVEVQTVEAGALGIGVAPEDTRTRSRLDARLIVALGTVWLVWGSTFAGMRAAVATIPPFAMASSRFLLAGALLYGVCVLRGKARFGRDDLVRATITGGTLLFLCNGMTAWTVQFMPTSVNSLLLSLAPIWMVVFAFFWGGERPRATTVVGMLIGLAGLAWLLAPQSGGRIPLFPAVVSVLAAASWGFGSVAQRRLGKPQSFVLATSLQMLIGGALIAIEAACLGEWRALDVHAIAATSWLGFGWLVVFGSLAGYSAYLYTMQYASTALASTYGYVNPIVAVALGMLLFHEHFTPAEAVAGAIIIASVALMMLPARPTTALAGSNARG